MLAELGLDIPYTARVVRRGELADYLAWAEENGVTGFNATMPHKEDLLPLLDELDGDAKLLGAVNTVCRRRGRWVGHNTDGAGFLQAMREAGMDPGSRTALVLGAGGAAKAVVPALIQGGANAVFVANRSIKKAAALCAWDELGRLTPADFTPETLGRLAGRCDLVVNCTSLGMGGTAGQFPDFDFLDTLPRSAGVYDLIYHPAETELLMSARLRGLRTSNGLGMLVWQAVFALEFFLDTPLDRPRMAAAAATALEAAL